jgi:hypothetical protein
LAARLEGRRVPAMVTPLAVARRVVLRGLLTEDDGLRIGPAREAMLGTRRMRRRRVAWRHGSSVANDTRSRRAATLDQAEVGERRQNGNGLQRHGQRATGRNQGVAPVRLWVQRPLRSSGGEVECLCGHWHMLERFGQVALRPD